MEFPNSTISKIFQYFLTQTTGLTQTDINGNILQSQMNQGKRRSNRQMRQLDIGETVVTRDYTYANKWKEGVINARTGPLSYQVKIAPNQYCRRHLNQLISPKAKDGGTQRDASQTTNGEASEEAKYLRVCI